MLVDVDLTGMILGMTLATKPEEIYRALIEATAYGTRMIIETFEASGVPVHEIVATGGLPDRNKLLMQIYADVTGRPIKVAGTTPGRRLGSAMHGAVAAGKAAGGYDTIVEATKAMTHLREEYYAPQPRGESSLRPALCRVRHAPRLLRARRQRRDEAAEDAQGEGAGGEGLSWTQYRMSADKRLEFYRPIMSRGRGVAPNATKFTIDKRTKYRLNS